MAESEADPEPITVSDHVSVTQRLDELGCAQVEGLAILPRNFSTAPDAGDLLQVSEAATLLKLFAQAGLPTSRVGPPGPQPVIVNRGAGWIGPTLFISAGVLSQNNGAVAVALNVLSNYLTEWLKGGMKERPVKLDVVVERKRDRMCKRISYEGPISGLNDIQAAVERLAVE